jgi:predicted metal-dependent hydrolase
MEQRTFIYGRYSYNYYIVFQERKTIALTVQPNLNIILKCPFEYCENKIETFLKRKWAWLEEQLKYFKKFKKKYSEKEYVSGESFLYLGRQYKLLVKEGSETVCFSKGKINITTIQGVSNQKYNKKILESWYKERTEILFQKRYKIVLAQFNYDFTPELITRKMNKRWGSFLSKKKIILNPDLIKSSKECIDYVITHELCHMKYKNHNKIFYKLLESKIPRWKQIKEELELRMI